MYVSIHPNSKKKPKRIFRYFINKLGQERSFVLSATKCHYSRIKNSYAGIQYLGMKKRYMEKNGCDVARYMILLIRKGCLSFSGLISRGHYIFILNTILY